MPADVRSPLIGKEETDLSMSPQPSAIHPGDTSGTSGSCIPPLPRPRPPELTMQQVKPNVLRAAAPI